MNTVTDHYDKHLAEVYSWLAGDWDAAVERNRALLANTPIAARCNLPGIKIPRVFPRSQ